MSGHETVTMRDHPSAPETRLRGRPAKRLIGEVEIRDHSQLASRAPLNTVRARTCSGEVRRTASGRARACRRPSREVTLGDG